MRPWYKNHVGTMAPMLNDKTGVCESYETCGVVRKINERQVEIIELPIKTLTLSSPGRFSTDLSKKAFWAPLAISSFPSWGISTDL